MKKTFMLLAMAGACLMAQGQFAIVPTDTIVGRANHFYYLPYWYDDCHYYQEDTCAFRGTILFQRAGYPGLPFDDVVAEEHYAQQELAVRGLAAMVRATDDLGGTAARPPSNPWRNAETLILTQGEADPPGHIFFYPRRWRVLDSLRWDTAAPKLMRLPVNTFVGPNDTTGYVDCYLYEAMFDVPQKVHDTFYIVGTFRSNIYDWSEEYEPWVYRYTPTVYQPIISLLNTCGYCPRGSKLFIGSLSDVQANWSNWIYTGRRESTNGPFLPIIVAYSLQASASPAAGGTVEGTGRFPEGWRLPLTAVPAEGYTFSHWSDGSTDNPRLVDLSADTTFTAVFQPL